MSASTSYARGIQNPSLSFQNLFDFSRLWFCTVQNTSASMRADFLLFDLAYAWPNTITHLVPRHDCRNTISMTLTPDLLSLLFALDRPVSVMIQSTGYHELRAAGLFGIWKSKQTPTFNPEKFCRLYRKSLCPSLIVAVLLNANLGSKTLNFWEIDNHRIWRRSRTPKGPSTKEGADKSKCPSFIRGKPNSGLERRKDLNPASRGRVGKHPKFQFATLKKPPLGNRAVADFEQDHAQNFERKEF